MGQKRGEVSTRAIMISLDSVSDRQCAAHPHDLLPASSSLITDRAPFKWLQGPIYTGTVGETRALAAEQELEKLLFPFQDV